MMLIAGVALGLLISGALFRWEERREREKLLALKRNDEKVASFNAVVFVRDNGETVWFDKDSL